MIKGFIKIKNEQIEIPELPRSFLNPVTVRWQHFQTAVHILPKMASLACKVSKVIRHFIHTLTNMAIYEFFLWRSYLQKRADCCNGRAKQSLMPLQVFRVRNFASWKVSSLLCLFFSSQKGVYQVISFVALGISKLSTDTYEKLACS